MQVKKVGAIITCLADAAFRLVTADDDETSLGTEIATPDHSWAVI